MSKQTFDRAKYTKQYITQLNTDTFIEGNKLTIAKLESLIYDANFAYYNTDIPLINDNAFDILIDILKQKKPDSAILKAIGAELPDDTADKVSIPYHLGSMDKVKPGSRDLELWLSRNNIGPYIISEKLDGLSGLLVLKYNKSAPGMLEKHLYRRGDNNMSQEITHLLDYITYLKPGITDAHIAKYIMSHIPTGTLAVRGELIIKKSVFNAKYTARYPKTRSLINGVVLSKAENFSRPELKATATDIEYLTYSILDPVDMLHEKQFIMLDKGLGFKTASWLKIPTVASTTNTNILQANMLQELLLDFKLKSEYDIDGIIVADDSKIYKQPLSGNPKYAVAFKMMLDEQVQLTTVKRVEWNITKNKLLKPRVEFDSVSIGGDTIMFATGFNAKFIMDKVIGPGAKIKIVRSGDVIPYIVDVISPAPNGWSKPEISWSWTASGIDAQPNNLVDTPDYLNKQMSQFFTTLEVDGVQTGTLDKLINAGYDNIGVILSLKPENLLEVSGFQIRSAEKLVDNIHKFVLNKKHPLEVLMTASNIFPGFGVKKLGIIIGGLNNNRRVMAGKVSADELVKLPGISTITADKFIAELPKFIAWLHELPMLQIADDAVRASGGVMAGTAVVISPGDPKAELQGKAIVFTGFRNKELELQLNAVGGRVSDTISASTYIIVAKDTTTSSTKLTKARDRGITILDIEQFVSKYKFKV